jgi:hypothetical protein
MTAKRRDGHSTEFGLWLREQDCIDSSDGFIATNLDYIWTNYKTGYFAIIEEKRYASEMRGWQRSIFRKIDSALKSSPLYRGFVFLQFENTSPEDGWIKWNGEMITEEQLRTRLVDLVK